jgi:hypothetical protein
LRIAGHTLRGWRPAEDEASRASLNDSTTGAGIFSPIPLS